MIKTKINLIPKIKNPTDDYFFTWQTQLYVTSGGTPLEQAQALNENYLFGDKENENWANFFLGYRNDLIIVLDDGWDMPLNNDKNYRGSLILSEEKFPSFTQTGNNTEALLRLVNKFKEYGWKGVGIWICAQEAPIFMNGKTDEEYWIERLKASHEAGISYWKVDWGKKDFSLEYRKELSRLGKIYAPNLVIDHAKVTDVIPYSDVFRTYDVPAIMSIPTTLTKIKEVADVVKSEDNEFSSILNCEDELYTAAAGGFIAGISRFPLAGNFPNGHADNAFPDTHRNLKSKMVEIHRTAAWHKIAPAFEIKKEQFKFDDKILEDNWLFENVENEMEVWWLQAPMIKDNLVGDRLFSKANAQISRCCKPAEIVADTDGNIPYVVTSKNPSGAFSVATLGRTFDRYYYIPKCDVSLEIEDSDTVGIFGEYKSLTLNGANSYVGAKILMQDLADEFAFDITDDVVISNNKITIPGELISKTGTVAQDKSDTSEPGVVLKIEI